MLRHSATSYIYILASVPALSCRLGRVSYNRAFGALMCYIQSRLWRSLTHVTKSVVINRKKIPRAGFELRIKSLETNKKTCSNLIPDHRPKVSKSGVLPTVQWIAVVNGCLDWGGG